MKNLFKKKLFRYGILAILIIGLLASGKALLKNNGGENTGDVVISKQVKTEIINSDKQNESSITTVGTVEAETKINVLATAGGTLRALFFSVGDTVIINQRLAQLQNNSSQTSLNNAKTNLNNSEINLFSTERISEETIRQTEIAVEQARVGVKNGEESIRVAELGLKSAQDNLANAKKLQEKRVEDTRNQSIISFTGYLNMIFNARDQVKTLLSIDSPLSISPLLGAEDSQTVNQARQDYQKLDTAYSELTKLSPNTKNIENNLQEMIDGLSLTENMLNSVIAMLDKTVSASSYPKSLIDSQLGTFQTLRSSLIQMQSTAKSESQTLSSLALSNETELDGLRNAVNAADAQLSIAKTAKANAELAQKNAEQAVVSAKGAREQQILGAKTQVDNARGQLNLSQSQTSDLSIKAPIGGTITQKYVETGAEISPGQQIAEISQTNNLKIVVNISSEDIYRIKLGQKVMIGDNLEAIVYTINPAADPVSKKVKVEILFDNSQDQLIQGTFVDVSIPVDALAKTSADSIYIPLRALTITQNEKFVFVNQDNFAKKIIVETGKTENALVEIISGLKNNDELVVDGAKNLEDGSEINIVN